MKLTVFILFLLGIQLSCVPHTYVKTESLRANIPKQYANASTPDNKKVGTQAWWKEFNDEKLDQLVTNALKANLDIEMSKARLDQALALARKTGAAYWPKLEASAGASRSQSISPFTGGELTSNRFDLSVAAAYEIDLWGKYRNQRAGALADVNASIHDVESVSMTIAAQVAETWYFLGEQRSQARLLQEQTAINETMFKLVKARFEQGLASALDVYQQQQQLIRTRRRLQPTSAQVVILENQLAVLLGKTPGEIIPTQESPLPELHNLPKFGLPADLILRRPDIRSAEARIIAADHRVASAFADRFPAIRLSASGGLQAQDLEDLIDNFVWNLVGGLVLPLFDGGSRSAEVQRQEAVLRLNLAQYKKTVLLSLKEVEDALIRLQKKSLELKELDLELKVSQATFNEAQNRYLQGLSNYLPVLTALASLQESQRANLNAKRQLTSYRIQLYRALGGPISSEVPKDSNQ